MNKVIFAVFIVGLASLITAQQLTKCLPYADTVPLKIAVAARNTFEPYSVYSQYARVLNNTDLRQGIFEVVQNLEGKLQSYVEIARVIDNRVTKAVVDRQTAVPTSYIQDLDQCGSDAQNVLFGLIDVLTAIDTRFRDQLNVPANCKCDDVEPIATCTDSATQTLLEGVPIANSIMEQNDQVAADASADAFACVQGVEDNYDNYSF